MPGGRWWFGGGSGGWGPGWCRWWGWWGANQSLPAEPLQQRFTPRRTRAFRPAIGSAASSVGEVVVDKAPLRLWRIKVMGTRLASSWWPAGPRTRWVDDLADRADGAADLLVQVDTAAGGGVGCVGIDFGPLGDGVRSLGCGGHGQGHEAEHRRGGTGSEEPPALQPRPVSGPGPARAVVGAVAPDEDRPVALRAELAEGLGA